MLQFRSPSLLIRISHLILIQIIFIFSALALVIFYPQNADSPAMQYSDLNQKILTASQYICERLKNTPRVSEIQPDLLAEIGQRVSADGLISDADLIWVDSITGKDSLIHLGISETDYSYSEVPAGAYKYILSFLNSTGKPFLRVITRDGKYLVYAVRADGEIRNYALILTAANVPTSTAQNSQAYLLFLLFLVSALISLLIINLIYKGIKKPLNQLLEGFEKTAAGQDIQVEETGDFQIRSLIHAFNEMSWKLSNKRAELAEVNHQLVKANRSLIESESILTALVDYSPDAIIVTDLDDQVIIYNQATARDFGYNQSNMMGRKMTNLIPVFNNSKTVAGVDNDIPESQEVICRRKDGSKFPAVLIHTTLGPEGSRPIAMLYFIRNISESTNYQDMILKLDRIASKGKMARDIAHEINNYLAILQGNLELVPLFLAKNDMAKLDQKLRVMKDTVAMISNFTDGLTRFSDENSEFAKEDLNQLIENLIAFLKPQNKFDNISICTNLSENLPLAEIDCSQIQLLIVNLMRNSAEAMAESTDGKWIVISTSYDESTQVVTIKFADSGPGVNEEYIPALFVRRFSSKRDGNGLGLITCKNIVENHKGEIKYSGNDDSKSIFTISFPVSRTCGGTAPDKITAEIPGIVSSAK